MKKVKFYFLIVFAIIFFAFSNQEDKLEVTNMNNQKCIIVNSVNPRINPYIETNQMRISRIPTFLLETILIKTTQSDKMSMGNEYISFDVNKDVSVYIAHWDFIKTKPKWISEQFENTGIQITTDDTYTLYKKNFKKGKIVLGGNLETLDEEDVGMYFIFISDILETPSQISYTSPFKHIKELLNQYDKYAISSHASLPNFSYQDQKDSILAWIKKEYNLESIAGNGDEISRIINLMKWVNKNVPHNGNNALPKNSGTKEIIDYIRKEDQGVNCRRVATVLNDIYLAMGYRSRFITCLPHEDYDDGDCHVTNMVFSQTLNKWIYMDPSFSAYVTNDKDELLSPMEFRQAINSNDSIVVRGGLSHNGKPYGGGQKNYLKYMTKNLFRFSCPLRSEYGYESDNPERLYLNLNPLSYKADVIDYSKSKKRGKRVYYYTTDDTFFFASPISE